MTGIRWRPQGLGAGSVIVSDVFHPSRPTLCNDLGSAKLRIPSRSVALIRVTL